MTARLVDTNVRDVDEQYLITVGELLYSAALAQLDVEVLTGTGRLVAGVPFDIRAAPNADDSLLSFRIGPARLQTDEILRCTIHARSAERRRLDQLLDPASSSATGVATGAAPTALARSGPRRLPVGIPGGSLQLTLAADDQAPTRARRITASFVRRASRIDELTTKAGRIVYELAANAVRHAYDPGETGSLTIDLGAAGETLTILVSDDGRGPHVSSPKPGSGRGWKIVSELSDEFVITQRGLGGTLVYVGLRLG